MQNESRLDRMVEELRDYSSWLDTESKRVQRALAVLEESDDSPETSTTDMIMEVFEEDPRRVLSVQQTVTFMRQHGWVTESSDPVNVVRAALARLAKNGQIERPSKGAYQLKQGDEEGDVPPAGPPPEGWAEDEPPPEDEQPEADPWSTPPSAPATYDDEPPF